MSSQRLKEAVASLCNDELKPYGRILRKRLLEICPAVASVELPQLREFCQQDDALQVCEEAGGEWSATLKGKAVRFVDVYSPDDIYDQALWQAIAAYFGSLPANSPPLSGGRYACGLDLQRRNLSFLRGRSLGQICHIVQLAISQKKILGYQGSDVVPYARSQSFRKELSAQQGAGGQSGSIASWEVVPACIQELLEAESTIALSNLKRLFHARFQLELCETALGCAKLSELLRDERLSGVCHIRLENGGYAVVLGSEPVEKVEESPEDGEDDGFDYDGAAAAFYTSHLQDSIRSVECPWGPTPEGSFIMPAGFAELAPACNEVRAALEKQQAVQKDDDEDEDYDAAVDRFYGSTAVHDSIRSNDYPWGPTPEHSFNECDPRGGASVIEALQTRLAPLVEKSDGFSSTDEGYEEDDSVDGM